MKKAKKIQKQNVIDESEEVEPCSVIKSQLVEGIEEAIAASQLGCRPISGIDFPVSDFNSNDHVHAQLVMVEDI